MADYLKRVLKLVRPYRFRFSVGLLCGFLSGLLAFTVPLSLKLAVDAVFPPAELAGGFTSEDVKDFPRLAQLLSIEDNPVSRLVSAKLDAASRTALAEYLQAGSNAVPGKLPSALILAMNKTLAGPCIYETGRFDTITNLRPDIRVLLARDPRGKGLRQLNRMLLEDAYPEALFKRSFTLKKERMTFVPRSLKRRIEEIGGLLEPSVDPSRSWKIIVIAFIPGSMLLRGLLAYLNVYMLSWVSIRVANDLRIRLFQHILQMPMGFFSKTSTGDLTARIEGAMGVINTINTSFATIIRDPISIVCLLLGLFGLEPGLSLATLVVFPVCLIPVVIYGRKLRKTHAGIHSKFANAANVLYESFSGIRVIKSYNLESRVVSQFRQAADAVRSFFMRSVRASELPGPMIEFIGSLGVAMIFAYYVFVPNRDQGNLWAFFMGVFSLYAPFKNLSRLQSQITVARVSVEPALDLLQVTTTVPEPAHPKPLRADGVPIRFEHVSFAYDEREVLHDIDLTIQPGQLIALVGQSGSGKSSLVNLLLRFYDPQKGCVKIGDTDLREVSSHELRARIATVAQDTILFNTSIRENIALGRPGATNAEIEEAAKHAYAHGFITNEKQQGYETSVGERGVNVSGGQRQRIAIARAILRDAPILILDEATNALDAESEHIVQTALESLTQGTLNRGRTTICIAHRLSTIQKADLIVVLEDGRIVETGTHEQLLKLSGVYRKLYELSFKPTKEAKD